MTTADPYRSPSPRESYEDDGEAERLRILTAPRPPGWVAHILELLSNPDLSATFRLERGKPPET